MATCPSPRRHVHVCSWSDRIFGAVHFRMTQKKKKKKIEFLCKTRKSSYEKPQEAYRPWHNLSNCYSWGEGCPHPVPVGGTMQFTITKDGGTSLWEGWGAPLPSGKMGVSHRKGPGSSGSIIDGGGVPPGKDMGPVEVLWNGNIMGWRWGTLLPGYGQTHRCVSKHYLPSYFIMFSFCQSIRWGYPGLWF